MLGPISKIMARLCRVMPFTIHIGLLYYTTKRASAIVISLSNLTYHFYGHIQQLQGCIQKFPDWPSGARTANGIALCHQVQLYRYFMS